jgi:hypothetical protein
VDLPDPATGATAPTWFDAFTGEQKTPGQGALPADAPHSGPIRLIRHFRAIAKTGNESHNVGDTLLRIIHFYWQSNSLRVQWFNSTQGKVISQQAIPSSSDIIDIEAFGIGFQPTTSANNGTMASLGANTDSGVAIATNPARQYLSISNNSTGVLWVNFGSAAYSSGGVGCQIAAGAYREWASKVPISAVHMACTVSNPAVYVIEG